MSDSMKPRKYFGSVPSAAVCLTAAVATFAFAQTAPFKPLTAQSKMAVNGIGPVRLGMTLAKAIDATQVSWKVEYAVSEGDCRYAHPENAPKGADGYPTLSFMVVDGVVVRAEVGRRGISTVSGVQVGDTEQKVKETYPGKIKVETHPYDDKGHYLIYTPTERKDAKFRLIFETDGKVVTSYRAGRVPEVHWIEGCL
ncbi:MAG: hypothetical protein H8F28_16045 [Fibrella sp.]|nr:hypothetical protein [Armatimonadota bacterium]